MLKGAIARRYAMAIFDIARKQNTIDRTLEDVKEIAQLFAIHAKYRQRTRTTCARL